MIGRFRSPPPVARGAARDGRSTVPVKVQQLPAAAWRRCVHRRHCFRGHHLRDHYFRGHCAFAAIGLTSRTRFALAARLAAACALARTVACVDVSRGRSLSSDESELNGVSRLRRAECCCPISRSIAAIDLVSSGVTMEIAVPVRPARPVRPMRWHVIVGMVRHVEIEDVADGGNVEAAGGDVGGDQQRNLALAELIERGGAGRLIHVAVQGADAEAVLLQRLVDRTATSRLRLQKMIALLKILGVAQQAAQDLALLVYLAPGGHLRTATRPRRWSRASRLRSARDCAGRLR